MKILPTDYEKRMRVLLGDEYEDYYKSLQETPVRGFRVNTDKISPEEFLKTTDIPCERIPYVENGFYFEYDKIGNLPCHHAGKIYVQEPGAMAPGECVDIEPDWVVLDMCAAPGGKSSQLRNKLCEDGVLVSNEIIPSRCKVLTGNVERLGLKNTVVTCMDTARLADVFPNVFDFIMVDAPCSGEGMFRKDDVAVEEWSVQNVLKCAKRQREIIENASKCLKPGGYIVYATCTFSLEENEMLIDSFLSDHPEFEIIPVNSRVEENTEDGILFEGCKCSNLKFARRFYPHKNKGEGQFMAVLHNRESAFLGGKKKGATGKEKVPPIVYDFLDSTLVHYKKENVIMNKGTPVYFTPDFNVNGATAFCTGVTIGEIKKGYIQPHHQFFMAMGKDFKRKIELNSKDDEVLKYLHGEEISASVDNGWAVVTVDGCSLGGAKVTNSRGKNHYPKGLRV